MPAAAVNGIDLNYKLEGDGEETIVLINGLADDLETWALQMDDFFAVIQGHDTSDRLGEITAPVLVLAGEEDILIPVALSRRLHEGIPGSEWATTKGGHACVWEHPAEFNRAYLAFLGKHSARRRVS